MTLPTNDLLTADLHLTDNPKEEYRWKIFDELHHTAVSNNVQRIFILGDLTDRKDRHSGELVNRLVDRLKWLSSNFEVIITMGNHDIPLKGTPFWSFLDNTWYVTTPVNYKGVWLLPFSFDPATNWKSLPFDGGDAIFMHQTLEGSIVEGERVLTTAPHPMPVLPQNVPVFSGDIHKPQKLGNVIYVGAPYPVRYSEMWNNRLILINKNDYFNPVPIPIRLMKRGIYDIKSLDELQQTKFGDLKEGDQIKVRMHITGANMTTWPQSENAIRTWAATSGIELGSVGAILTDGIEKSTVEKESELELMSSEQVIRSFSEDEKISDDVLEMGLELLKDSQ